MNIERNSIWKPKIYAPNLYSYNKCAEARINHFTHGWVTYYRFDFNGHQMGGMQEKTLEWFLANYEPYLDNSEYIL